MLKIILTILLQILRFLAEGIAIYLILFIGLMEIVLYILLYGVSFMLIPHWYLAIPVAFFGLLVTTSLCGFLWYEIREVLTCTDRLHRILAAITLILALPVGLIAFYIIPNWSDFNFNGHPSLVAVAGSVDIGILSFILAAGVVAFLGIIFSYFLCRFMQRSTHLYKE